MRKTRHMCVASGILWGIAGIGWGQVASPSTSAPSKQAAIKPEPTKTMLFRFKDVPVETVLTQMAERFGVNIIHGTVPGRITMDVPGPVDVDQAIELLNNVLIPMHLAVVETMMSDGETTILRVMTLKEAKRLAPVMGMK